MITMTAIAGLPFRSISRLAFDFEAEVFIASDL